MSGFTTRPEIRGTFGVVTSTHWIASAAGMGVLERGGNAFDAAVVTGLVLQVVEPHLNGPAGDLPAIFHSAKTGKVEVLCAQGVAPKAATIEHYRGLGLELVPGSGLLATVVPGAFDGWMLLLRDHGTITLREALTPAMTYARDGHPMLPRVAATIIGIADYMREHWPTSHATWVPDGIPCEPHKLFRNPGLARTWERMIAEGEKADGRDAQIDAARAAWAGGFVADAIAGYLAVASVMDVSGEPHRGVLAREDLAEWRASYEAPATLDYHGWTLCKTGPWGQGPVLLQALAIMRGFDIAAMDPNGDEFVHTVVEAIKLAYADREAYYGDPKFSDIPLETLLSEEYAAERRRLIGARASLEQRPGRLPGFERQADAAIARAARKHDRRSGADIGEPTMAHLTEKRGDTVHLDVIDAAGNFFSATPSGGWLQSSPVIPGLGFPLNSRAQMFWLDEGSPSSLRPGARPRTTLTPTLALKDGRPAMVFGSPGGDQQDQWQLVWFLRHVHHGFDLQAGIDAPLFHSLHFQASFYPREAKPGEMMIEPAIGAGTIDALRARGHVVHVSEPWAIGRMTAAARDEDGILRAAATPRLMQAYAVGR